MLATIAMVHYYTNGLRHSFSRIAPAFLLLTISCGFNSYQVEKNEKKMFLEKIQNEILQKDLKKVLQVLPEGVMIFKR